MIVRERQIAGQYPHQDEKTDGWLIKDEEFLSDGEHPCIEWDGKTLVLR